MTPFPTLLHHDLAAAYDADMRRALARPARAEEPCAPAPPRRRPSLLAALRTRRRAPEPVLATILFTDIVGSTARAAQLGDRAWRDVLTAYERAVLAAVARHHGRLVKSTGDGSLATFAGPGRAIAAACAIREEVARLGLEIRAGLHAGECAALDGDLNGIVVHIGARVAASARPGEIRVSRTVTDLVAGSTLAFDDRGAHTLRGVPGRWELYAVAS